MARKNRVNNEVRSDTISAVADSPSTIRIELSKSQMSYFHYKHNFESMKTILMVIGYFYCSYSLGQGVAISKNIDAYHIQVTVTPIKNQWLYLYSFMGKPDRFQIVDSAYLNEHCLATFRKRGKLEQGIYLLVDNRRSRLFEFLIGREQQFSILVDTSRYAEIEIRGSSDNTLYLAYSKFLSEKTPKLNSLQQEYTLAKTGLDSSLIKAKIDKAKKELNEYRNNIIKTYPNSLLTAFFKYIKRPESQSSATANKEDSFTVFRFMKEHFWDNVDFSDARVIRTPFYEEKLDEYFRFYVSADADSIIPEVNYILLSARRSKEASKYLLGRFTDKYINPEVMGQDKVFVFLFNNYFSKGDTGWLNAGQKKYIFERAYSLMTNLIGEQAPVLDLVDSVGKPNSLYGLQGPFTFVLFWDPNCGHCKETVPRIDSIYKASWKNLGVKVYAVNVDENALPEWRKYINEHKLGEWTHVYQTKQQRESEQRAQKPNFRQLYDVFQTPTMYLLGKEKRIIAKKLSIEQFNEVILAKTTQLLN